MNYPTSYIEKLNQDILHYPEVTGVTSEMKQTFEGISRLIMLDRYAFKDIGGKTLAVGDLVILTTHPDPQYPARGIGSIEKIERD